MESFFRFPTDLCLFSLKSVYLDFFQPGSIILYSPAFSIENVADAIVLTEWKIVKFQNKLLDKAIEARKQSELYSSGIFGGIEIANYRFLVMVTEKGMKMPDDQIEGNVTYRHINIAVNPDVPSKEART